MNHPVLGCCFARLNRTRVAGCWRLHTAPVTSPYHVGCKVRVVLCYDCRAGRRHCMQPTCAGCAPTPCCVTWGLVLTKFVVCAPATLQWRLVQKGWGCASWQCHGSVRAPCSCGRQGSVWVLCCRVWAARKWRGVCAALVCFLSQLVDPATPLRAPCHHQRGFEYCSHHPFLVGFWLACGCVLCWGLGHVFCFFCFGVLLLSCFACSSKRWTTCTASTSSCVGRTGRPSVVPTRAPARRHAKVAPTTPLSCGTFPLTSRSRPRPPSAGPESY